MTEKLYSEKIGRTQILKAKGESRNNFLKRGNNKTSQSKLTFNMNYCQAFQNA